MLRLKYVQRFVAIGTNLWLFFFNDFKTKDKISFLLYVFEKLIDGNVLLIMIPHSLWSKQHQNILKRYNLKTFAIVVANGSEETRYNRDLVYIQRRQTIKSTIVPFIFSNHPHENGWWFDQNLESKRKYKYHVQE